MTNPKQMNANYRKNERLLESNPTPIDIGLSEDVKNYIDENAGEEYTAGTGIEITGENVINNVAPVPAFTTSDEGKFLTVKADYSSGTDVPKTAWDTLIKGYTYRETISLSNSNIAVGKNESATKNISFGNYGGGLNDYIIICSQPNSTYPVIVESTFGTGLISGIDIKYKNCGESTIPTGNTFCRASIFTRPRASTQNNVIVIGFADYDACRSQELPATLGTAGQILAVNSGATGVEWTNPAGVTAHTFTSFADIYTALYNHNSAYCIYKTLHVPLSVKQETIDDVSSFVFYLTENSYNSTTGMFSMYSGKKDINANTTSADIVLFMYGVQVNYNSPSTISSTTKSYQIVPSQILVYY